MTFLLELSHILSQFNKTDRSKHIKIILCHLLPGALRYTFSAIHQIPQISLLRHYLKLNLNLELCNYTTNTLVLKHDPTYAAVNHWNPNQINPYPSEYGTVCTLQRVHQDKYDLRFEIYNRGHVAYHNRQHNRSTTVINLPYPPRGCIINKNNLIGDSLNGELVAQINKLKQDSIDFEERESIVSSSSPQSIRNVFGWIENTKCNTKILKQYIIDPLLNTNKYMIPTLLYVDKSKRTCEILSEINNCPRLYNAYFYDLIEKIFYKFVPTIEYMLNLNDLDKQIIQVIISCHIEMLKPNTNYVGNLHPQCCIDGESIQIGCIYYFDKSQCLIDDILQMVSETRDIFQYPDSKCYDTFNLNINKNDCVVFNNSLINHKVHKLSNTSNELGYRGVMTFWLPKYKINSSREINVLYKYKHEKYNFLKIFTIVRNWVRLFNQQNKIEYGFSNFICKDIENVINNYIVSSNVWQYSNYATNTMVDEVDMEKLENKRQKLRNSRTYAKMKHNRTPQWMHQ